MSTIEKVTVIVVLIVVIFLLFGREIDADTGKFYLDATCPAGSHVELAWLVPPPAGEAGTYEKTLDGWAAETALWKSWKEFEALFSQGCSLGDDCYNLVYDLNRNLVIEANDFSLLKKSWASVPEVAGNLNRVEFDKARTGVSFNEKSCVQLEWYGTYFNPFQHLYQACVKDGKVVPAGPNGEQWRGPVVDQVGDITCQD